LLAATRKAGNWMPFVDAWSLAVGPRAAQLLARVLTTGQVHADRDGLVQLTVKYVENSSVGYGPALQAKLLARLEEEGLIEQRGYGKARTVRVNVAAVRELSARSR
jgi:hypothetical protein